MLESAASMGVDVRCVELHCGLQHKQHGVMSTLIATHLFCSSSLDLNHRPALGTLVDLWNIVVGHIDVFRIIIFSVTSLAGVARILRIADIPDTSDRSVTTAVKP